MYLHKAESLSLSFKRKINLAICLVMHEVAATLMKRFYDSDNVRKKE